MLGLWSNLKGIADVIQVRMLCVEEEGDLSGGRAAAAAATEQGEEVTWTLTGWSQFPEE